MKQLIIFIAMMLVGCSSNMVHQYNTDDKEDRSCFSKYGSAIGYCGESRQI